jgi:hypothetical protein
LVDKAFDLCYFVQVRYDAARENHVRQPHGSLLYVLLDETSRGLWSGLGCLLHTVSVMDNPGARRRGFLFRG